MARLFDRFFQGAKDAAPQPPGAPARHRVLPEGTLVYAIGDIHGCLTELQRLEQAIVEDAAGFTGRKVIVCLGDYVDRGPHSATVVEHLIGPPPAGFERICIGGNHETHLLDFLRNPRDADLWLGVGGLETLTSYGVPVPLRLTTPSARQQLATAFTQMMPAQHGEFMANLPSFVLMGRHLFVHAGIRPGVPLDQQSAFDMMLIGNEFLNFNGDFGFVVVHGHTPVQAAMALPNRIPVDTGAYGTGRLSCVRVFLGQVDFITADRTGAIRRTATPAAELEAALRPPASRPVEARPAVPVAPAPPAAVVRPGAEVIPFAPARPAPAHEPVVVDAPPAAAFDPPPLPAAEEPAADLRPAPPVEPVRNASPAPADDEAGEARLRKVPAKYRRWRIVAAPVRGAADAADPPVPTPALPDVEDTPAVPASAAEVDLFVDAPDVEPEAAPAHAQDVVEPVAATAAEPTEGDSDAAARERLRAALARLEKVRLEATASGRRPIIVSDEPIDLARLASPDVPETDPTVVLAPSYPVEAAASAEPPRPAEPEAPPSAAPLGETARIAEVEGMLALPEPAPAAVADAPVVRQTAPERPAAPAERDVAARREPTLGVAADLPSARVDLSPADMGLGATRPVPPVRGDEPSLRAPVSEPDPALGAEWPLSVSEWSATRARPAPTPRPAAPSRGPAGRNPAPAGRPATAARPVGIDRPPVAAARPSRTGRIVAGVAAVALLAGGAAAAAVYGGIDGSRLMALFQNRPVETASTAPTALDRPTDLDGSGGTTSAGTVDPTLDAKSPFDPSLLGTPAGDPSAESEALKSDEDLVTHATGTPAASDSAAPAAGPILKPGLPVSPESANTNPAAPADEGPATVASLPDDPDAASGPDDTAAPADSQATGEDAEPARPPHPATESPLASPFGAVRPWTARLGLSPSRPGDPPPVATTDGTATDEGPIRGGPLPIARPEVVESDTVDETSSIRPNAEPAPEEARPEPEPQPVAPRRIDPPVAAAEPEPVQPGRQPPSFGYIENGFVPAQPNRGAARVQPPITAERDTGPRDLRDYIDTRQPTIREVGRPLRPCAVAGPAEPCWLPPPGTDPYADGLWDAQ